MPFRRRFNKAQVLKTIRFRLAAALAIALLPVLALSTLQSVTTYSRESEDRHGDMVLGAERSAAIIRARLNRAVLVLESWSVRDGGAGCGPALTTLAREMGGGARLFRFDAQGRALCSSNGAPRGSAGSEAWLDALRAGARSSVVRAPPAFEQRPSLLAAVPLGPKAAQGAFAAVLPLAELQPGNDDPTLPAAEVGVADSSGRLLTSTDRNAFPAPGGDWAKAAAASQRASVIHIPDLRGRERMLAAAPLPAKGVLTVLSAPTIGLFSWARLNPIATFVLPLLAWLVAMAAVLVVTERVVIRWLGYLERIAAIYAKGRFTVRPVQAVNAPLEIRTLAQTLDHMAEAIEGRDASLRDSLAHKDALMREIHHRVKNNLQVISSLLNMQQRSLQDPAARVAMSDTRQRITALSLIYRALYQSPDLKRVNVRQFLEELIAQLISGEGARAPLVRSELDADPLVIDPDKLAPLALWAVEAISNAQKHAFDNRGGWLRVRFKVGEAESVLEVEDDGPGADDKSMGQGVGRTLMTAFARQLRGRAEILKGSAGGVLARLTFPTPEAAGEAGDGQPPARNGKQAAA